ncbi:MAG: hypothetical protein NTY19_45110 [Planctomycetota bacterium]|nr:hypothetical protein [Planctomycetota bacterium]
MTRKAREWGSVALFAVFCVWLLAHKINDVASQNVAMTAQVAALEGRLDKIIIQLNSAPAKVRADLPPKDSLGSVEQQLKTIDGKLTELTAKLSSIEEESSATAPPEEEQHTTAEAKEHVKKIGTSPAAEKLAEVLVTIDTWLVKPDEEKQFVDYKRQLAGQLREKVKQEVTVLQKAALEAKSGKEAAKKHTEAGRVLVLYPMSEDSKIIEAATQLSVQQAELATRMEVIRRQRYNRWATERIEAAIDGYNSVASRVPFRTETGRLIESLVENLGEVDPTLLEPVVLDLYNYGVDVTKKAISDAEKLDLAKKMTDPSIKRKTLGDF